MKYVDRLSLGVERFFDEQSQLMEDVREYSPEEFMARLAHAPYRVRFSAARLAADGIAKVLAFGKEIKKAVPEKVADLARLSSAMEPVNVRSLRPFFEWISDIYKKNEQGHISWLAAARDAASRLDRVTGDFIVAFTSLINQRIVIKKEGDTVVMTTAEREWGVARLVFPQAEFPAPELEFPIMGYLFCMETEAQGDSRFGISMMIDTQFSDEPYVGRMLQDEDWLSVDFTCGAPEVKLTEYDYVGRLRLAGTSRSDIVRVASSLLIGKLLMVGREGLRTGEREMIPFAKLIHGSMGLIEEEDAGVIDRCEELVTDVLENRYALSGIKSLLIECDCGRLVKHLEAAGEYICDEDDDAAFKEIEKMAHAYVELVESGSARRLLYKLEEKLVGMFSDDCSCSVYSNAEKSVASIVDGAASEKLKQIGFSGVYPHYVRRLGDSLQYLSFVLRSDNYRTKGGEINYNVALAVGKTPTGASAKFSSHGVPIDAPNALDCVPEKGAESKYGELAGEYDDIRVNMTVDVFHDYKITLDESEKLSELIDIADDSFGSKALPPAYRDHRRAAFRKSHPIIRAFGDNIHYGVIAALVVLVLYAIFGREISGVTNAVITACLAGAAVPCVISICGYISGYRRIWRF